MPGIQVLHSIVVVNSARRTFRVSNVSSFFLVQVIEISIT